MLLNFKFRCFAIRLFIEFVEGGTAFGTCFIDFIRFFYVIHFGYPFAEVPLVDVFTVNGLL